jgi:hypothetical protein
MTAHHPSHANEMTFIVTVGARCPHVLYDIEFPRDVVDIKLSSYWNYLAVFSKACTHKFYQSSDRERTKSIILMP